MNASAAPKASRLDSPRRKSFRFRVLRNLAASRLKRTGLCDRAPPAAGIAEGAQNVPIGRTLALLSPQSKKERPRRRGGDWAVLVDVVAEASG
jgi:hypothetical protein